MPKRGNSLFVTFKQRILTKIKTLIHTDFFEKCWGVLQSEILAFANDDLGRDQSYFEFEDYEQPVGQTAQDPVVNLFIYRHRQLSKILSICILNNKQVFYVIHNSPFKLANLICGLVCEDFYRVEWDGRLDSRFEIYWDTTDRLHIQDLYSGQSLALPSNKRNQCVGWLIDGEEVVWVVDCIVMKCILTKKGFQKICIQ